MCRAKEDRGPHIDPSEVLYRIVFPRAVDSWLAGGQPSSAAFKRPDCFSVDVESKLDDADPIQHCISIHCKEGDDPTTYGVIRFRCQDAVQLGFEVRDELDEEHPENPAHAHVYPPEGSKSQVKRKAGDLADLAEIAYSPPES